MTDTRQEGARVPPRFVPTLTEVVKPAPAPVASAANVHPPMTEAQLEQIVGSAIQRAEAALTERLPEVLAVLLHEHALALSDRLRREIRSVVQQSLTEILSEQMQGAARGADRMGADS